jgi:inner membrane transporter RhtA
MGVWLLVDVRWSSDPLGLMWAGLNAALFVGYIVLGHRAAADGAAGGVERLGAAMAIAFVVLSPIGLAEALAAFAVPQLVVAGVAVGVCSSVIPYVCDQLAMSRLPRASFALLLALLPVSATVIAAVVLTQIPTLRDLAGVGLVVAGVAIHRPSPASRADGPDQGGAASGTAASGGTSTEASQGLMSSRGVSS